MTRDGTAEPSRETKFSGANGDREIFILPVQLTTNRIGNLTRLILTLAIWDDRTIQIPPLSRPIKGFREKLPLIPFGLGGPMRVA